LHIKGQDTVLSPKAVVSELLYQLSEHMSPKEPPRVNSTNLPGGFTGGKRALPFNLSYWDGRLVV